jgi:hypothetical protein
MSGQINENPNQFSVKGNIAPVELSKPTSTTVFNANHCTLSLKQVVILDGNSLTPIRRTPS